MTRSVDLERLHQMTRDVMRVYEAGVQAQPLTAESLQARILSALPWAGATIPFTLCGRTA